MEREVEIVEVEGVGGIGGEGLGGEEGEFDGVCFGVVLVVCKCERDIVGVTFNGSCCLKEHH